MKNIFIYPSRNKENTISKNPYMEDLYASCSKIWNIINNNVENSLGIINFLIKIKQIDILWLNWIENLPDRKFGLIQSLFYFIFFIFNKFWKIKIIYTVHNKVSHSPNHFKIKRILQNVTINNSALVITHSTDGLDYIKSITNNKNKPEILYIPHPTKLAHRYDDSDHMTYMCDILIWGTIYKYKGIKEFLEYLYKKNLQNKYKIKIVGKVVEPGYYESLLQYINQSISIEDNYISQDDLQVLFQNSKTVLFTYNSESVFSSGSLIESLRYNSTIIGPNKGGFKNLSDLFLIKSYENYKDLIEKIDSSLNENEDYTLWRQLAIDKYLKENTWENFSRKINKLL